MLLGSLHPLAVDLCLLRGGKWFGRLVGVPGLTLQWVRTKLGLTQRSRDSGPGLGPATWATGWVGMGTM